MPLYKKSIYPDYQIFQFFKRSTVPGLSCYPERKTHKYSGLHKKGSILLGFLFLFMKRSQEAGGLGLFSQLLRATKKPQALSLSLLHHSSMWYPRSTHSSRWLLELQPLILLPDSRKKGGKCQRGPPLPSYWLELSQAWVGGWAGNRVA